MIVVCLLAVGAFLSGSLMFSYWLGLVLKKNITSVGDGNPGALNLWKASGMKFGLIGIVLDFMKGYAPVLLFMDYADGYAIVPLALAPIAGHAFSPFLRGKGGKAIAVTFGVWSALTGFKASLVYAVTMAILVAIFRLLIKGAFPSRQADALQVVAGMAVVGAYLYGWKYAGPILGVWLGSIILLAYTHRVELTRIMRAERERRR
ncbi:glycerol-3-phosphate acyltransferase [Cohnella yongneupensis]|uniref:Glycerol-3-phosphate acyltransferase n=1 Tax=Cohnella yongneupensis TaxID=425006 RepID=A0ABW0QVG0_9BACL